MDGAIELVYRTLLDGVLMEGTSRKRLDPVAVLTGGIAGGSDRIPGDPAAWIIVASARHLGARLLTRDRRILDYAAGGFADVLAV